MRIDVLGVGFDHMTMEEAVDRAMELMQRGGIHADMRREDREDELVLTISIPRRRAD